MVLGMDGGSAVALYGATGRSPASLKRRFVEQGDGIYMTAIDATVTLEGVPELLEYPAVRFFDNGIIISNGNHIEGIESLDASQDALENLDHALKDTTYEPDEYKTPRITGCFVENGGVSAALHIARVGAPDVERAYFDIKLSEGVGSFISTYVGADVRPTPSFSGTPLPFPELTFGSAEKAAEALYAMLAPREGRSDYRIGVVAVYWKPGAEPEFSIVNRLPHL